MRVNEQKITTTKYSETHSNMDAYERLKTQTHNAMTNTLCSPICLVIATMRLVVQRCSRKDASAIYCAQHKQQQSLQKTACHNSIGRDYGHDHGHGCA